MRTATIAAVVLLPSALAAQAKPTFVVDTGAKVVPAAVGAGAPDALLASLRVRAKSEFESLEAFRERQPKPLPGNLRYVVQLSPTPPAPCGVHAEYFIETERLFLRYKIQESRSGGAAIDIYCRRTSAGKFTAMNAFGAKWPAEKVSEWVVELNQPALISTTSMPYVKLDISSPEARALKPSIRLLAVFEVAATASGDVVGEASQDSPASLDEPIQLTLKLTQIRMRTLALWVIDGRTGKVLAKRDVCTAVGDTITCKGGIG